MSQSFDTSAHGAAPKLPRIRTRKLPVIDLFAGVGGLSLGVCRAGFELRLAVENDPDAWSAHSINFPNSLHSRADILSISGSQLLKLAQLRDTQSFGLVGGPPCQGFSYIGRRREGDERNQLFLHFFDLVRETRPIFYIAENVPGILDCSHDALRAAALDRLDGYAQLQPFLVRAADYGVPTTRTRVLFFGYLPDAFSSGFTVESFQPKADVTKTLVRDAFAGLPKIHDAWLTDEQAWRKIRDIPRSPFATALSGRIPDGVGDPETIRRLVDEKRVSGCIATNHTHKTRQRFFGLPAGAIDPVSRGRRLTLDGLCPTLRAGTGKDRGSYQAVRPIHPTANRVITPREAARLQGFPDWYRFAPTKWHSFRQLGNSFSPLLAEAILAVVREHLRPSALR